MSFWSPDLSGRRISGWGILYNYPCSPLRCFGRPDVDRDSLQHDIFVPCFVILEPAATEGFVFVFSAEIFSRETTPLFPCLKTADFQLCCGTNIEKSPNRFINVPSADPKMLAIVPACYRNMLALSLLRNQGILSRLSIPEVFPMAYSPADGTRQTT